MDRITALFSATTNLSRVKWPNGVFASLITSVNRRGTDTGASLFECTPDPTTSRQVAITCKEPTINYARKMHRGN